MPTSLFANIWTAVNEADKLRWVCIAPFGDWDNKQGMQRFQRDDAEKIINEFNSVLHTPQRILGAPWYIGHPDHPAFTDKYKDTKAYGRIKSLEARQDGLYAGVRFGQDGEKLIADEAFHGHSVNWYLKQDTKNPKVWRPFRLKSVGFTNEPNIPVPTLTTANENENLITNADWLKGTALRREHMAKLRLFANDRKNMETENLAANGGPGSGPHKNGSNPIPVTNCPACGGNAHLLGSLGSRSHYRCESCGMDHLPRPDDDVPPAARALTKDVAVVRGKGEAGTHTHTGAKDLRPGESYTNERYQKIADWRLFANAGTSEGALAGWETRHGAAGAASAVAELKSKRAEESGDVHDHVEAMKAHEEAAGKWAAVGTAEGQDKVADHLGKEQMHRTKAAELARTNDADALAKHARLTAAYKEADDNAQKYPSGTPRRDDWERERQRAFGARMTHEQNYPHLFPTTSDVNKAMGDQISGK